MNTENRLILLTNDDGIWAPGLEVLAKAVAKYGRVVVVAPDRNRSAVSSAMSVHNILRLEKIAPDKYSCDGTPVDCVLMGVRHVLERAPDWILSGINWGYNLGEDVLYSGTVGAALEGCIQGVKSAAFSLHRDGNLGASSPWIERFLDNWEKMELPSNSIWNINLPECEPKGFRMTTQDRRNYYDLMEQRLDPRGKPYFWIGGEGGPEYAKGKGTDTEAVYDGFVSLTPLNTDLSCRETLARRSEFDKIFEKAGL
ncbi:MAG: 5'/3'-nucleotidase SurE [Holophagales bacterium]|jgi:5'-nucleotidase|nr:5'/3'-nucleotidase SurE [Holophagales bacterium]